MYHRQYANIYYYGGIQQIKPFMCMHACKCPKLSRLNAYMLGCCNVLALINDGNALIRLGLYNRFTPPPLEPGCPPLRLATIHTCTCRKFSLYYGKSCVNRMIYLQLHALHGKGHISLPYPPLGVENTHACNITYLSEYCLLFFHAIDAV